MMLELSSDDWLFRKVLGRNSMNGIVVVALLHFMSFLLYKNCEMNGMINNKHRDVLIALSVPWAFNALCRRNI